MSERFKERYRIPSARLQNWDYGWNGLYFITICSAGREHYFGEIIEGKMRLSEIGLLAERFWFEIPLHFPFILLEAFVVMPNHIHGILIIDKIDDSRYVETRQCLVSTYAPPGQQRFRNPGKNNISTAIGSYKSVVSKHAHQIITTFDWQTKFYDQIIRSDDSLNRIREYIQNNPSNWEQDKFFN